MLKAALLVASLTLAAAAAQAAPLIAQLLPPARADQPPPRLPVLRAPTDAPAGQVPDEPSSTPSTSLVPQAAPAGRAARKPATCLNTRLIRQAIVIDDTTIRMVINSKRAMDLKLRGTCFGLRFDESFYYQPGPTGQLCERFDTIVTRSGHRCMIDAIVPVETGKERK